MIVKLIGLNSFARFVGGLRETLRSGPTRHPRSRRPRGRAPAKVFTHLGSPQQASVPVHHLHRPTHRKQLANLSVPGKV